MPQIKIESNLPIIFITLMLIGITVFMIFEFKKINERINKIVTIINGDKIETIDEIKKESIDPNISREENRNQRVEQWRQKSDFINENKTNNMEESDFKQNIIDNINNPQREEPVSGQEEEEYIDRNMFTTMIMSRGLMGEENTRADIQEITQENVEQFEDEESEDEESELERYEESEDERDEESSDERDEESEDERDEESGAEIHEESDIEEVIDLKNITTMPDDFEKEKIDVDESYSVNELKQLCKNMGLSVSGNKTTLISRIMDYQK